ncbi:hypothetical protein OBE_05330 [human gut metagenome]|jgi:aryl-alcohol dehydrogenase-like predicted oxidoreductase|uniref:Aldo/keto reductase n=1 Tax=human gut metagenome TaxID=408170 RepID=K1TMZ8_9ZZZZ
MNEKEIEKSYNLGIDFFDTANCCSSETSEEYLGKALKNNVQKYLLHKKKGGNFYGIKANRWPNSFRRVRPEICTA